MRLCEPLRSMLQLRRQLLPPPPFGVRRWSQPHTTLRSSLRQRWPPSRSRSPRPRALGSAELPSQQDAPPAPDSAGETAILAGLDCALFASMVCRSARAPAAAGLGAANFAGGRFTAGSTDDVSRSDEGGCRGGSVAAMDSWGVPSLGCCCAAFAASAACGCGVPFSGSLTAAELAAPAGSMDTIKAFNESFMETLMVSLMNCACNKMEAQHAQGSVVSLLEPLDSL